MSLRKARLAASCSTSDAGAADQAPGTDQKHNGWGDMPEAIAVASPARREELCRIVVERVVIRDRRLESIAWTPPVRPFFEKQRVCPQGDSNP